MTRVAESTAFFFAPFVSSVMRVDPAWIDYNGHLNLAYYHVLFDKAVDEAWLVLGMGPDYLAERNGSTFAAESHVVYKRELKAEDPVRATVQLVDFDGKRLHLYQELRHSSEGWLSATCETLSLHMDMTVRKVSPFPADILASIAIMKAAHSQLPRPEHLGRVIGIPAAKGRPGVH